MSFSLKIVKEKPDIQRGDLLFTWRSNEGKEILVLCSLMEGDYTPGIVIKSDVPSYPVGYLSNSWQLSQMFPFRGTIELKQ